MRRRFPLVAIMVVLVGAVLAVSIWTTQRAGREALREFSASEARVAEDTAAALHGYLDWFDRDTRLLATFVQGTRRQAIEPRAQDQVVLSAFQALATVVAHYRTIALFGPRAPPIVAIDPTEDRARIAPALVAASAPLASEVTAGGRLALRGPLTLPGGRSFYLLAVPAGAGEAVVVTADAAMMLEAVSRAPSSSHNLVIFDPSGALWLGCEQRERCRLLRPGTAESAQLIEVVDSASHRDGATSRPVLARLGLPSSMVVGTAPPVDSPLGRWSVALIGSAADIDVRQRTFVWHIVLTSIGVVATMLLVGLFILRQRAEAATLAARVQAAEEMATLRERSDKIIENVPVGILGITADGRLTLANRFFQERIAKDASGTAPSGTDLSQWASELRTHLDRALATGRNQILTDAVAGTQGRLSDFHIRVVPLSRPADDVEALALVEDLSELHSLQRQLVRAEKLVTVGVLSAGIAHEIGTPLAVIRVRAEHMLEQATDPRAADDLRAIVAQIDRISSTIRQVLEFSRQLPIEPGPADARGAVTQALELLDWRVSGKRLSVSVEAEESLPPVAAAADQLEQVVVNLLMNACDASANGGRIDVTLGRDAVREDCVRLAIADHGVGIPPENLNAVFDPYFTTKKHGEGTGLGLAIAAQIVRSHRGEISLKSTVGAGTVATVLWPVAERGAGA